VLAQLCRTEHRLHHTCEGTKSQSRSTVHATSSAIMRSVCNVEKMRHSPLRIFAIIYSFSGHGSLDFARIVGRPSGKVPVLRTPQSHLTDGMCCGKEALISSGGTRLSNGRICREHEPQASDGHGVKSRENYRQSFMLRSTIKFSGIN
jgi:hypothetical protein